MRRLSTAAVAAILLPMSAGAYDAGVAPRYPSQDQYRPNMDGVILRGDSSTGNASGLCAKLPDLGVCRSLADRARDLPNVMDAVGVVCDGRHDDADGIISSLNYAVALQGTVRLPMGKTCGIGKTITLARGHLLGGGIGSSLKPLAPMTDMVKITATLSSVRDVSFVNVKNGATNAVRVDTASDALHVFVERNYFTGFPGSTIVHDRGQHLVYKSNVSISNANMFIANNDGVNDVIEDNYHGPGGNGILFQRTNPAQNGTEGAVIRGNVIFAQGDPKFVALKVTSNIDMHIVDNTFESDCNTVVLDGIANGVSFIHSVSNWIGTRKLRTATTTAADCAAVQIQNGVRAFVSTNDVIAGRRYTGIRATAQMPEAAVSNISLNHPTFENLTPDETSAVDLDLTYVSLITVTNPIFSGDVNIKEGPGVIGRVDGGTFTKVPNRVTNGLRYGVQNFGLDMISDGGAQMAATANAVEIPFKLSYPPLRQDINVVLAQRPANDVGSCAVVEIRAASFVYQCFNPPGGSGMIVGFKADITR